MMSDAQNNKSTENAKELFRTTGKDGFIGIMRTRKINNRDRGKHMNNGRTSRTDMPAITTTQ